MTTLDDLKPSWNLRVSSSGQDSTLRAARESVAKVRRDVLMRDVWLLGPLVALSLGAGVLHGWARTADWLLAGLTAVVAVAVFAARQTGRGDRKTLRDKIEQDIRRVTRQLQLLRTVGYWFLLPMQAVVIVSALQGLHERTGSFAPTADLWILFATSLVLAVIAVWLCRREAQRRFAPLLESLMRLSRDLGE